MKAARATVIVIFLSLCQCAFSEGSVMKSIQAFGVLPTNTPDLNKANLQKAIDWSAERGAALYVEPSDEPSSRQRSLRDPAQSLEGRTRS